MDDGTSFDAGAEGRFRDDVAALGAVVGNDARRRGPSDYLGGPPPPGARKSMEPMAERLEPDAASRRHQAIRHFVAEARRSDAAVRERVRAEVLPAMLARAPVERWVVDDTPIHESGPHSVGVAVQYSGPVRATANRQVLVGLSVATAEASLPVASELHRPEAWAEDRPRRRKACVPPAPPFRTKNEIALAQVRRAVEAGLPRGILLADGGYGDDRGLRAGARALGLDHCVVVRPSALAAPADAPAPGAPRRGAACRAHAGAAPLSTLARGFRAADGREVGAGRRFAARRVRTTPCLDRGRVGPEEWLPVEDAERPADRAYWLCSLPAGTPVEGLARHARARARVERDLRELKQEVGLDAFEGRGWRGFDHHVTPCLAAHGFLVRERGLSPLADPPPPARTARHRPDSLATPRRRIARDLALRLPRCPCCGASPAATASALAALRPQIHQIE